LRSGAVVAHDRALIEDAFEWNGRAGGYALLIAVLDSLWCSLELQKECGETGYIVSLNSAIAVCRADREKELVLLISWRLCLGESWLRAV
jgi:hypothetical protein